MGESSMLPTIVEVDDDHFFDDDWEKVAERSSLVTDLGDKIHEKKQKEQRLEAALQTSRSSLVQINSMLAKLGAYFDNNPAGEETQSFQQKSVALQSTKELHEKARAHVQASMQTLDERKRSLRETTALRDKLRSELHSACKASLAARATKAVSADIVFVMDCTGSMQSYIDQACKQCCRIIDKVKSQGGTICRRAGSAVIDAMPAVPLHVRFGCVAYRDYEDGDLHLQHCDLSDNTENVQSFIRGLQATGGGDDAEDVIGGLRLASTLTWQAKHRTIILFADAPNHGIMFHNGAFDHFVSDQRTVQAEADIPDIMAGFKASSTDFLFARIRADSTQKMENKLRELFAAGPPTLAEFSHFDLSDNADFYDVVGAKAVSSLSRSFTFTMSSVRKGSLSKKAAPVVEPAVEPGPVEWPVGAHCDPSRPPSEWQLPAGWKVLENVEESFCLMSKGTSSPTWQKQTTTLLYHQVAFACGAMRAAYYFYHPVWKERLVGKRYMTKEALPAHYSTDIEMQHYANCIAKDANVRLAKAGVHFAYNFILPWKVRVPSSGEVFNMEYLLMDEFTKYNSNTGWVNTSEVAVKAAAFSHFSHAMTHGTAMVVDIQGVGGCCFTDPQVHSVERNKYGFGNLGHEGMVRFYLTHQCNTYCKLLGVHPERRSLQPNQLVRDVKVSRTCEALCAICGSADIGIEDKGFIDMAARRKDILCQRHVECYQSTLTTKHCDGKGCARKISYSTWYVQQRGQLEPSMCFACSNVGKERQLNQVLVHAEQLPAPSFDAAKAGPKHLTELVAPRPPCMTA